MALLKLGILLLVVRVLVDMATPHAPGAFRLDPSTSIEADRAPHAASVVAVVARPSRAQGHAVTRHVARQSAASPLAPAVRALFPGIVHVSESPGSPPASDDD
ncbi:MAG: hypothetical protein ACREK6_21825 [Candidatus Rokuibacteriota bacterium]